MLGQKREYHPPSQGQHAEKREILAFPEKSNPSLIQEQKAMLTVTAPSEQTCFFHHQIQAQSLPEAS